MLKTSELDRGRLIQAMGEMAVVVVELQSKIDRLSAENADLKAAKAKPVDQRPDGQA